MTTIQTSPEVVDFLEHFGRKGMHWGVRNAYPEDVGNSVGSNVSTVGGNQPRQGMSTAKKIAIGAVIVAGAAAAAIVLKRNPGISIGSVRKAVALRAAKARNKASTKASDAVVMAVFKKVSKVRLSSFRRKPKEEMNASHSSFSDVDDELVADFLEHFGVKGMKWGVHREVRRDATKLSQLRKGRTKSARAKTDELKREIEEKIAKNPVYAARVAHLKKGGMTGGDKAKIAAIGLAFVAFHPALKGPRIAMASTAGKAYRRLGESEAQRFLRRNAYTHVPVPGRDVVDVVERSFGALGRGVNTWNQGYPK